MDEIEQEADLPLGLYYLDRSFRGRACKISSDASGDKLVYTNEKAVVVSTPSLNLATV